MCMVATTLTSSAAFAHPYHVSRTELNWNATTGNFEVALCLWPADLEKALSRDQGKPIDLDKVENLDELLKAYVEKTFLIRSLKSDSKEGKTSATEESATKTPTVRWVGHEKNLKQAWLYFEVVVDKTPAKWTVENRAFFELNEDQLNYLQVTAGKNFDVLISKTGSEKHSIVVGK